jgi:hypothetical protein
MIQLGKILAIASMTIVMGSSATTLVAQIPRSPDGIIGGTVTSVTADQATIKTIANEPFTILFAPKTTFFKQIGNSFSMSRASAADVHVGGSMNVQGHLDPDGTTDHANNVMILSAEMSQKVLDTMRNVPVQGEVAAIHGNRVTLKKHDNTSQVVEIDEDALLIKGSGLAEIRLLGSPAGTPIPAGVERMKLTDIKIGNMVYTRGAPKFPNTVPFKDNIFVANRLAIQEMRPRRTSDVPHPAPTPQ